MDEQFNFSGKKRSNLVWVMTLLGLLAGFFLAWYFLDFSNNKKDVLDDVKSESVEKVVIESQGVAGLKGGDSEVNGVVEKILKHMLLPPGELTVLTVNDGKALQEKNAEAFKYVKNGDKLVIYSNGFIIYDLMEDKIVDVIRLTASGTPIQF